MFWVRFVISGFIVASIPWVSKHFSNQVAGYVILVPVIMTLSLIVQYLSRGPKATIEMITATLLGLPTLLIFGLVAVILMKNHVNLPVTVGVSLAIWFVSVVVLNTVIGK